MSGSYVNVAAEDLTLGDFIRGKGRVVREPCDHDTLEGFVTVIFSSKGREKLSLMPSYRELQVRCLSTDE